MNLNEFLPSLNRLENDGAVIILKWDGARASDKKTVVISKPATDYIFRIDTDDLETAIKQGIEDYDKRFQKTI
ncbi:MAG: hypothetical protein ACXU7H_11050 [Burkholderiaceae bacterium]